MSADRRSLSYKATCEDSEFLAEPVRVIITWVYRPDIAPSGQSCDLSPHVGFSKHRRALLQAFSAKKRRTQLINYQLGRTSMHQGSCLCGAVTYEVSGEFGNAYFCHCKRCRKASGAAFATNARITPDQFRLVTGHEFLKTYHSAASGLARKFCGECGSPVVSERTVPPIMVVRLGTLDTPLSKGPGAHIFVNSKVEWDVISDNLPQFPERPAG